MRYWRTLVRMARWRADCALVGAFERAYQMRMVSPRTLMLSAVTVAVSRLPAGQGMESCAATRTAGQARHAAAKRRAALGDEVTSASPGSTRALRREDLGRLCCGHEVERVNAGRNGAEE